MKAIYWKSARRHLEDFGRTMGRQSSAPVHAAQEARRVLGDALGIPETGPCDGTAVRPFCTPATGCPDPRDQIAILDASSAPVGSRYMTRTGGRRRSVTLQAATGLTSSRISPTVPERRYLQKPRRKRRFEAAWSGFALEASWSFRPISRSKAMSLPPKACARHFCSAAAGDA